MADNTPYLIINPNADDKRLGKRLDIVHKAAKDVFGEYEFKYTNNIGDGIPLAQAAKEEGYNVLVSVGGDGTLNELINVAVKTDMKVGMIPAGSANDSHKTHGIPQSFERGFQIVSEGYSERFPCGHAKGDNERYFIEMVNGGFIGETALALAGKYEWIHSEIGYVYVAIRIATRFKPIKTKVTIDGKIVSEDNMSCLAIALTDHISDMEILPNNHIRKGDFGVIFLKNLTGLRLINLILKAGNGKHVKNKNVEIIRGKHVLVESEIPHIWESEGEIPSRNSKSMEVNYVPDAINLIIPKGWKYGIPKKERKKAKKNVLKGLPPFG